MKLKGIDFRKRALHINLALLFLAIVNLIFNYYFGISFTWAVQLGLHIALFISGLVLFFCYIKPLRSFGVYALYYPVSLLILGLALITKNLMLGLIAMMLLYFFQPEQVCFRQDEYSITKSGHFNAPLEYKLKIRMMYIFEKEYATIHEYLNFETLKIESWDYLVTMRYTDNNGNIKEIKPTK